MIEPSGATPTEGDLLSHRYHHHTAIGSAYGKVFVAYSSGGTSEDASGQMTLMSWSDDDGDTWSTPRVVVPPQSTFAPTGAPYVTGTRVSEPRCFVNVGGDLYLVAAVDDCGFPVGSTGFVGASLVAAKVNSDGTTDTLYRVSAADYDPQSGIAAVPYDAAAAALVYPTAKLYGVWGGSAPGQVQSDWPGWIAQAGSYYTEPTTLDLGGNVILRLWRSVTTDVNRVYQSVSRDGGQTFERLIRTTVPNAGSVIYMFDIPGKGIGVVGNPMNNGGVVRDPLYLAVFDRGTGRLKSVNAIRQGLSDVPVYPGTFKNGGAAYPGAVIIGTDLHVCYSIHKESVGHSRIPLASIP